MKSAKEHLNTKQLTRLRKGLDIVGDIAIVRFPDEFQDSKHLIAKSVLDLTPHLKVILEQTGPVESRFRTRKLAWLAGEHRTETVHRESGCQYRVNLETAYFSPRLSHERMRLADLVTAGECIVNFFAGVGSFSILIAKQSNPSRIYSLDINPFAIRYHAINNMLNRVHGTIDLICGDANQVASTSLVGCADRVLLPLPDLALESLPTAKRTLKNEHGMVHCYVFVESHRKSEACGQAISQLRPAIDRLLLTVEETEAHVVRSVGPCRYQVCLDMRI